MAVPEGTSWSEEFARVVDGVRQVYRLGIYVSTVKTATDVTAEVRVFFFTKHQLSDRTNDIYFRAGTDATVDNAYWVTKNHSCVTTYKNQEPNTTETNAFEIYSVEQKFARGDKDQTIKLCARINGIDMYANQPIGHEVTLPIPAIVTYTVSYYANDGSGAPANQTKKQGINLQLRSTVPTRTGYTFGGWALSQELADQGTAYYQAGNWTGKDENLTLYAVWTINTYTIAYDANGGTGAPGSQTKTYGVGLFVPKQEPTRDGGYEFVGWGLSPTSTEISVRPGSPITVNENVTYYAVWKRSGMAHVFTADDVSQKGLVSIHDGTKYQQGIPWIRTKDGWKEGV